MLPFFTLFGKTIQTYSFCAAAAGVVFILLCIFEFKGRKLGIWRLLLPLLMVICALIGARGFNVLLHPAAYGPDFPPWKLSYERLSLIGGLAAGLFPLLVYTGMKKRAFPVFADALVLPASASIVILKFGCFFNGCCIGKYTRGPFGMIFPANEEMYRQLEHFHMMPVRPHTVHPAQLYEISGTILALVLTILLCRGFHTQAGGKFGLFTALFSCARLCVLPFRQLPYADWVIYFGYPAVYLAIFAVGLFLFIRWGSPSFSKNGSRMRYPAEAARKRNAERADGYKYRTNQRK